MRKGTRAHVHIAEKGQAGKGCGCGWRLVGGDGDKFGIRLGDRLNVMEKRSFLPPAPPHHVAARTITIAMVVGGTACAVVFALYSWAQAAVLTIAGLLGIFAALRAFTPGRPWFSSRNRIADVTVLSVIAAAIVYFSPYVNVVAP